MPVTPCEPIAFISHIGPAYGVGFCVDLFGPAAAVCSIALCRAELSNTANLRGFGDYGGALYLLFSGASIATERAFIMTVVILGAVILCKRAITLRAVAIAACIVLILRPQAILSAGFQMSFAASIALVYVFEWVGHREFKIKTKPCAGRHIRAYQRRWQGRQPAPLLRRILI